MAPTKRLSTSNLIFSLQFLLVIGANSQTAPSPVAATQTQSSQSIALEASTSWPTNVFDVTHSRAGDTTQPSKVPNTSKHPQSPSTSTVTAANPVDIEPTQAAPSPAHVISSQPPNQQSTHRSDESFIESNSTDSRYHASGSLSTLLATENDDDDDSPVELAGSATTASAQSFSPTPAFIQPNQSTSVHPLLIYSIRFEIRSFDLWNLNLTKLSSQPQRNISTGSSHGSTSIQTSSDSAVSANNGHFSRHPRTLIGGLKNTIGLDFLYREDESYIFWTDVIEERIYRGTIVNGAIPNVDVIVQTGLATAEGLAVDWIGLNIYWVESTLDHIEVASINGSHRRTLVAGNMESPRAIALDPRYGLMFWSDWDKRSPRIEKATMSGDERDTLVNISRVHGGWPNGLTLDYDTLRVYWIDANSDSIHSVDYLGNNYQEHLRRVKSLEHPFSITLFQNHLFWTDWKTNSVSFANKNVASDARELQRSTNRLFDIKVFHPSRQPRIENRLNPCYINNGGCSHLCLLSVNHTGKCECPRLMKLARDGLTCEVDEKVLLVGRINDIRAVDLIQPLYHVMAPISVPKVFYPKQFEYDAKTKTIFWADSQTNEVKRASLIAYGVDTIIDVIIEAPSGLALDWISGNIYVSSAPQRSQGKIFLSNLNGEYISILMDSSQDVRSPRYLAVHPVLGLLFYIDENDDQQPLIYAASMDGKNRRVIVSRMNSQLFENPTSLAIDYELNRVYWINQAFKLGLDQSKHNSEYASIQYYSISEDKVYTLLDESTIQASDRVNPSILCIDGDYLILGGRIINETIIKLSKHDPSDRTILQTQNIDQLTTLKVYNASSQIGTNACSRNNGDCSQLCVPINSTHRSCKCTMGFTINPLNEIECIGKDTFLTFSYNLGMKGVSLEPNSSSDDYYLPPIHKAFRASSIDFVHKDNLIYWVDNEEGSIIRINRDTTNYQVIIQGLESEESIAIDWVAGNIYWLDPYYDLIEVARLNGSDRYVVTSGDMDKANGIVVNPLKGYIVWSDIGSLPKIEIAAMDGSWRRTLVSTSLAHIDDLAIDYYDSFIYWVDSTNGTVQRIQDDGSNREIVYTASELPTSHLVSIAIHKEYLYIADSASFQGSIIRLNLKNPTDRIIIHHQLGDGIRDIAIFAEQPMPSPQENPCVQDNGGCEDLCIFKGKRGARRCICSHGKLNEDGLTCRPFDTFLVYSKFSQIDSLHITDDELLKNTPYSPITIENRGSIISLAVDYNAHRVIYSEISRNQICSVLFNGTDRRVLIDKQSMVEGIAFSNNQLYWNSVQDSSISRLNISSNGILEKRCSNCPLPTVEKIVKFNQEDKPRGIAIDDCTSYVYWTNWNTNASIQRASPHNNFKVETIINSDIKVPNGIAIDQKLRKLYWCDARLDKIETCDMDGSKRVVLISAMPQHPFALAVWDNYVFWTDWLARGVFRADKYTGQRRIQMKKVVQRPMGIAVAAPNTHVCPHDPCLINNGGCREGFVCITHHLDSIECKPQAEVSHDLSVPVHRCKHLRNGNCELMTYHDVIMDSMDRYNLTDTSSLDSKKPVTNSTKSVDKPSLQPDKQGTIPYKNLQPKSAAANHFVPPVISISNTSTKTQLENRTELSLSTTTTLSYKATDKPSTESIKHIDHVEKPIVTSTLSSVSSPPSNLKNPSDNRPTTGSQATQTQYSTTTTQLPTQAPLSNSSQPCQIVPAALSPTDSSANSDCKSVNNFKCYLSDRSICIPIEKRCDGNNDCPSKEDENDCYLSKRGSYNVRRDYHWYKFVPVILIILAAAVAAMILVFGTRGRRRWLVGAKGAFNHRRMFDDNGTNIEISNPMFDEDDTGNMAHCPFSIDLNERTTNFSNPLYERQVLLTGMNDKNVTEN